MPEDNFIECIKVIAEVMKREGSYVGEWYSECFATGNVHLKLLKLPPPLSLPFLNCYFCELNKEKYKEEIASKPTSPTKKRQQLQQQRQQQQNVRRGINDLFPCQFTTIYNLLQQFHVMLGCLRHNSHCEECFVLRNFWFIINN